MRIKKSIREKKYSPFQNKPKSDLDPTTNTDLHVKIWDKLKKKIANHSQM